MVLCDVYIKQPTSVEGGDMADPYLEHTAVFVRKEPSTATHSY